MKNSIIEWLFQTNAIQVCPEDHPFWYTSGTLGPYYINTHYLYGSKAEAEILLNRIEEFSAEKTSCPGNLFILMNQQYQDNSIYRSVMDLIIEKSRTLDFDFISAGERRDFFFSILAANRLKKPHVSIFKDRTAILSDSEFKTASILDKNTLIGKKALHIADLVTEASSYIRAWIPAIESLGARMSDTIAVVDRDQGGREILEENKIRLHSFAVIHKDLFHEARKNGYINENQYQLIVQFMENPKKFMVSFIKAHPDFLDEQIASGGKAKERAQLFIEKGFHLENE